MKPAVADVRSVFECQQIVVFGARLEVFQGDRSVVGRRHFQELVAKGFPVHADHPLHRDSRGTFGRLQYKMLRCGRGQRGVDGDPHALSAGSIRHVIWSDSHMLRRGHDLEELICDLPALRVVNPERRLHFKAKEFGELRQGKQPHEDLGRVMRRTCRRGKHSKSQFPVLQPVLRGSASQRL